MDPRAQRGFLNNNPGNLDRAAGEPWQGEIRDKDDPRLTPFQHDELTQRRFAVFASAEYGIRAMAKNLFAYAGQLGLHTVRELIGKWAPPNENDTTAYTASVCRSIGVGPDDEVSVHDYATLAAIVDAIIRVECGGMPYSGHEIEDGLRMAGVVKPATLQHSSTMKGGAIAAGSTAIQPLVASVQDPIQNLVDTLSPLSDASQYVQWTMLGLKVALVAVTLWGVWMMVRERKARGERDVAIAQVQEQGL